ncbi:hypothetical protein [Spirillospora sp. CA-128828]|uniref:hypothetical protein n=1 Tax=Spirillospora sp. CA-128828 TaxID=3240033 RepID=UPI003D912EAE
MPGQMIQWASAIEDSKVDADIAYWNIDGNLSDSAVQSNRGNGQWWLLNAYGKMSGHTVKVTPPFPNRSYTLQGVATYDKSKAQARTLLGGASGNGRVQFRNIDSKVFGRSVHALIQEIPWTGQIGDSAQPEVVAEMDEAVVDGGVAFDFGSALPALKESSAYQIVLTPGGDTTSPAVPPKVWKAAYEAEGAAHIFLRVDGKAEQEIHTPLGYKWVVWDHADTKVELTKGDHVITLAARSLDGNRATKGDTIIDKIDLSLPDLAATQSIYEAEYAGLKGASLDYTVKKASSSGVAVLENGQTATFWVCSPRDGESTLHVDTFGGGVAGLAVNGRKVRNLAASAEAKVFLTGGVNKITVTGERGRLRLDRIRAESTAGTLNTTWYEAEGARLAGTAQVTASSLAGGGKSVTGIGGERGNANTLTFDVTAPVAGRYALTVRYSDPEQSPATHYNPDPLARHGGRLRQRRDATGAVPAHLPRQQLLATDHPGRPESGREHHLVRI